MSLSASHLVAALLHLALLDYRLTNRFRVEKLNTGSGPILPFRSKTMIPQKALISNKPDAHLVSDIFYALVPAFEGGH